VKIEIFPINRLEASCQLALLARDMPGRTMDLAELDKPFGLTQENREALPPLSDETRERLKDKDYPDAVLGAIDSEAEANIYEQAELEPTIVNGKDALIRTDIDYDKTNPLGESNLDRMKNGRPPLGPDNNPVELHHIGQKPDSPLAELSRAEHRSNGNDNILHNKLKESEIDRNDFGAERAEYWKARAEQIEQQRSEGNT
jgi:hypothetical protein